MKNLLKLLDTKSLAEITASELETLYKQNDFLHYMLNSMNSLIFIADKNDRFVYVNDAACERYGYTQEEMLKMSIGDLDINYNKDTAKTNVKIFSKTKFISFNSVHKDKIGNLYPVQINAHYLEYEGEMYNFGIIEDERYIINLLNTQNEFVILTDGDEIVTGNDKFFKFLGYKNAAAFKKEHHCVCEFFIAEDGYMPNHTKWIDRVIEDAHNNNHVKIRNTQTSEYHIFAVTATPFDNSRYLINFHDITKLENYKKELETLAITDGLTSLYNRRHFNEIFPEEINRAKRSKHNLAFIMFDIDFFKQYNDSYGHLNGDDVLIKIATACQKRFHRASDFCFRLGGEEFGLLFVPDSFADLEKHAEDLREMVESLHIEHKLSKVSKYVTISVGAVISDGTESFESLYARADKTMYKAKNSGRNCIAV